MKGRALLLSLILGLTLLPISGCGSNDNSASDADSIAQDQMEEVEDEELSCPDGLDAEAPQDLQELIPEETIERVYEPVVFAIASDIHIDGPFESSTPQKVAGLMQTLSALTPAAEFIVVTGDLTDQMEEPVDTAEGSVLDALKKAFAAASIPVEPVLGNHDYYAKGGDAIFTVTSDKPARTALFEQELGLPAYHVAIHGGMNFVYLNSMIGPLSDESIGLNGSLGEEQLAWLDETLSDGVPAILFLHHPPLSVLDQGEVSLESLIRKHKDNVLAVFSGHIHVDARDNIEGVPTYLTHEGFHGQAYHHVRVDPEAGSVEVLNAADIDYGETVEEPCDTQAEPLENPEGLEGTVLLLDVPDGHIQPMGLGTYLREMMADIPIAIQLLQSDSSGGSVSGLITLGKSSGDPEDGAPAYMTIASQAPCVTLEFILTGPCFETSPVDLPMNLGPMFGIPLPPGWQLRAELAGLILSGMLNDAGEVEFGVLRSTIDFNLGAEDLKNIIITEYCAGNMPQCTPGAVADLPQCPEAVDATFFDAIPTRCDVDILGIGMRTVFSIFNSVPGLVLNLDANFSTFLATENESTSAGSYSPKLFAPAPEGNCPVE